MPFSVDDFQRCLWIRPGSADSGTLVGGEHGVPVSAASM